MSYAIIETSGKQFRVEPGRFYDVDRLAVEENGKVTIDRVLLVEDEGEVSIGHPFLAGATVEATVLRHMRGRKVIVYKMQKKKKTRRKQGHRQELTRIMIETISLGGASASSAKAATPQDTVPATPAAAEPVDSAGSAEA